MLRNLFLYLVRSFEVHLCAGVAASSLHAEVMADVAGGLCLVWCPWAFMFYFRMLFIFARMVRVLQVS